MNSKNRPFVRRVVTVGGLGALLACKMPPNERSQATSQQVSVEECVQDARETRDLEISNGVPPETAQKKYEYKALSCMIMNPPTSCEGEPACRTVANLRLESELDSGKRLAEISGAIDTELAHCASMCTASDLDLEGCAARVPERKHLPAKEQAVAYQSDIAAYCSAPGVADCTTGLVGRANVDYSAAAAQMISGRMSPGAYLALSRDRTRKLHAAYESPTTRALLCTATDTDGDWVVDTLDRCPNTPDLTATDDDGGPLPTLPPAPSAKDVADVFRTMHVAISPRCKDALVPERVPAGAFYWPAFPQRGTYILAGAVQNQPAGCTVWYEFDIQEITGPAAGYRYGVTFTSQEATTDLVSLGRPVAAGFVQFNPKSSDPGERARLGTTGGRAKIRYRVRVMNGNGARGAWSEWKVSDKKSCEALGFTCGSE